MNRTFLFALIAIACMLFSGAAIADQVIEGGTLADPIEYEWGLTDNLVVIGTGTLAPAGGSPDPNEGNIQGHAWLGGPDSIVNNELAIGKPGFKKSTMSGYNPAISAQGSLVLREDDTYGYKTVGGLTVDGDLNIGGGARGLGQLFIPVGSVTANSGVKVGIGADANGFIHIQGGSFTLGSSATMKLGDSEDPTTDNVPIGNGAVIISGGSMTAPSGSSVIVGSLGPGRLSVIGDAITAINIDTVDVTDKGRCQFTLMAPETGAPDVKAITSAGHFYLEDGSIIDMAFNSAADENLLSNYEEASPERVVDLVTSPDLKWNETGYHVALSPEDDPAWDFQVTGNTLQVKYLGGTGSDLIVNSGTAGSPTAISAGLYRDIYIGYGLEVPETPIVVNGHASINGEVTCTSDLFVARGDDCDGSLTVGTGGSLSVFAGNLSLGGGSGANATLNLEDDADVFVAYYVQLGNAPQPPTIVTGAADLNISGSAKLDAHHLMVGDYYNPGPASSVNQTGGTIALRGNLYIGRNSEAGAEGSSYYISGGTLDVSGSINVGFDNQTAATASTMHLDGSAATVMAEDFNLATYCTLKFTVDDGVNYTGAVTPIDLSGNGYDSFAYFHAQYLDATNVDPDNCAIVEMAFKPGTESLIASLPIGDPRRGIDILKLDSAWNLKWQANDTGYGAGGSIIDHLYGLKFADSKWTMSEVAEWDSARRGNYAALRAIYVGPQTPVPQPTADAGPDQLGLVAEEPVTLDGSGSSVTVGRSIVNYTWTWTIGSDDYSMSTAQPTVSAYFPVGTHTVTLTVTSDIGATDSDTCTISIPSARIPGDIDASDVVDLGDFVILKNHFGQKDPDLP